MPMDRLIPYHYTEHRACRLERLYSTVGIGYYKRKYEEKDSAARRNRHHHSRSSGRGCAFYASSA